jgi:hypothetical protein
MVNFIHWYTMILKEKVLIWNRREIWNNGFSNYLAQLSHGKYVKWQPVLQVSFVKQREIGTLGLFCVGFYEE